MANTLSLQVDSISSDRATFTVTDETTYSSPVRSAVGAYLIVQKKDSEGATVSTPLVVGNDGDEQTDVSWVVNYSVDGWYRLLFVTPPDYAGGTTYAIYDAVQDPATSVIYRSKQNANTGNALNNTTWWEEVDATIALNSGEDNESTNCDTLVYDVILTANSEYEYASLISDASDECCKVECSLENLQTYIRVAALIDGMIVHSDRSEMASGEKIARRLESIFEDL